MLRRVAVAILSLLVFAAASRGVPADPADAYRTVTPIKHLVVLFQENVSFDHYFATYPLAANKPGEPRFVALPGTPAVNGLTPRLLRHNPNAANPFRISRNGALTCDQDHEYAAEIRAYDGGRMDRFVQDTGSRYDGCSPSEVMGYFDGNTVTAIWNYAQHFAMSDNAYGTNFGPSTPGALNLVAGTTAGAHPLNFPKGVVRGTVIGDLDPTYDDCSDTHRATYALTGDNIGELLTRKKISWGWFEGGFANCRAVSTNIGGGKIADYIPHHEPFQYFRATTNPRHLPPSSADKIGYADQANHQYDLADFWRAAASGVMPAVSFIKAPAVSDGHAGYSDPLDEQRYLVDFLNRLQKTPEWKSTLVILTYDDSDGWYDHVMPPMVRQSDDPEEDGGLCGKGNAFTRDRCGYGPRLPFLVISPYSKTNFVSHTVIQQGSVIQFAEYNWNLGHLRNPADADRETGSILDMLDFSRPARTAPLILNPSTGEKE